jgi:predicted RNase H-like HicB family nuclease
MFKRRREVNMGRTNLDAAINKKKGIFIILTNIFIEEDNGYVVKCPELGISTQGDTIEESEKNIKDAIFVFLNSIESLGLRDEIFKKHNIKTYNCNELPQKESEEMSINRVNNENIYYKKTLIPI